MILLLIIHVISVSILISYHEYYYSPDQQRSIIYSPDFRWHQYIDEERTEWLLKDRHTELNNVNFENESRDSLDKKCLICFDEILSNTAEIFRREIFPKIKNGEYHYEDYIENDGVDDSRLHALRVKMVKTDKKIIFYKPCNFLSLSVSILNCFSIFSGTLSGHT